MKQLIVLIATIVLGIAISGIVSGFGTTAQAMGTSVTSQMNAIVQTE